MSASPAIPHLLEATPTRHRDRAGVVALLLAATVFAGLSGFLAVKSDSDLEADATTHFLFARFAAREHHYFVSVWGRPLCTAAYALVAGTGTVEQGRLAARFLSLGMALAVAAVTYFIARRQGFRQPALAAILLLAQPVFFLHSFSELTEIPFALLLVFGFLAYQHKQWLAMALCVGLLPLGRPEGFGFILMAAAGLVAHRRARWLPVLALPFLAWNFAGYGLTDARGTGVPWWKWMVHREWLGWVLRNWPYSYKSTYGSGPLYAFVLRWPVLVSPLVFPFMLVGLACGLKRLLPRTLPAAPRDGILRSLTTLSHEARCEIWIVLIPLSILVVHSILWWKGLMGSNGELRYLVIVGPFFAVSAARGWEWAWRRFGWTRPLLWAGAAALLPITANSFYQVVPLPLYDDGYVSRDVARWYQADAALRSDFPRIMPTPPGISFFMDLSQSDTSHALSASRKSVAETPPGAVLVWDPVYGQHNSSAEMCVTREMIEQAGWLRYRHFEVGDSYCDIFLSPRTIEGKETRAKYQEDWGDGFPSGPSELPR